MKDLNRIINRYIVLWMNHFAQVVNRLKPNVICLTQNLYVWQGSEYASKVGHKRTNKIIFESFVGLECC